MNAPEPLAPVAISPVEAIVADMRAGRLIQSPRILSRQNELVALITATKRWRRKE